MAFQATEVPAESNTADDMDYTYVKVETPQLGENFPESSEASFSRSDEGRLTFFCALCLRQCTPECLLEFTTQTNLSSADIRVAEQKAYQTLGVFVPLYGRDVCHTCWKLVQLITDFREFCAKAARSLEKFPMGVACGDDEWTSEATLSGLDQIHRIIWEHSGMIDAKRQSVGQKYEDVGCEQIDIAPNVSRKVNKQENTHAVFIEDLGGSRVKSTKRKRAAANIELGATVDSHLPNVQDDPTEMQSSERKITSEPIELEVDHYPIKVSSCNICSRNFDGKIALRMHQAHCTSENPSSRNYFCCTICTASFLDNSGLTFHLNKHKGVRPFKCRKFCDRTYASNFTRIKHERRYCEQDGRICSICGASLKNEASLEGHLQSVHGEAKYSCDICGRKFRSVKICQDHKRVHSDERKYLCTVCNKGFKSPFALKTHKRIHTQERPYGCHLCEQAFNYKVLLKTHIERYHGSNSIV